MKSVLRAFFLAVGCAAVATAACAQTDQVLFSFYGKYGTGPNNNGSLLRLANGHLIGVVPSGGSTGFGLVFEEIPPTKKNPQWRYRVIYNFMGHQDGAYPYSGLTLGDNGILYGMTEYDGFTNYPAGCGVVYQLTPPAMGRTGKWAETVLYTFAAPGSTDGCRPYNNQLLVDSATGSLFGTTEYGGGAANAGTLFRLDPPAAGGSWTETVLYRFSGGQNDGGNPTGQLAQASWGDIYGTAQNGGDFNAGTAWTYIASTSQFSSMYEFHGGSDAASPRGGLIGPFLTFPGGSQYDFLGTSYAGGGSANCPGGCGTVFVITLEPVISETTDAVVHAFSGADGMGPVTGLTLIAGAAWGVTSAGGGNTNCGDGCGALFKAPEMHTGNHLYFSYSPVYSFTGSDGFLPETGVAGDENGNVYGLTDAGPLNSGHYGTIYEYTP
jgi:uncharacterized repeat protein (TIGR03803 family)